VTFNLQDPALQAIIAQAVAVALAAKEAERPAGKSDQSAPSLSGSSRKSANMRTICAESGREGRGRTETSSPGHLAIAHRRNPPLRSQIFIRNAKNALNAGFIANANLNVSLFKEAGVVIDSVAFDKYSFNGFELWKSKRISDFVKMVYHRAIKVSEEIVGVKSIFGEGFVCLFCVSDEILMGRFNGGYASRGKQIKAEPQIDNGAHNSGLGDLAA
jgi:hypothetical protein